MSFFSLLETISLKGKTNHQYTKPYPSVPTPGDDPDLKLLNPESSPFKSKGAMNNQLFFFF